MFADEWKEISTLLKSPVTSVDSIKYFDQDDNQQTLDTSVYAFDMVSMPARIFFKTESIFSGAFRKKKCNRSKI